MLGPGDQSYIRVNVSSSEIGSTTLLQNFTLQLVDEINIASSYSSENQKAEVVRLLRDRQASGYISLDQML